VVTVKRKPDFKKNMYEAEAWANGELVLGVDEVGRSSLAGPIVAAAAILRPGASSRLLKDSKLLTLEERLKAYKWLLKNCVYGVGIMHHRRIDNVNIYQADLHAMHRAVMQVFACEPKRPSVILVDAMPLKFEDLKLQVVHFAKGERKSISIAAASIIAKVTRDALMERIDLSILWHAVSSQSPGASGKLFYSSQEFFA
jgi:ribonuclease HII